MTEINFVSKLQKIITRIQLWRAVFLLRKDYNDPSMQEFTSLDADEFLDCS